MLPRPPQPRSTGTGATRAGRGGHVRKDRSLARPPVHAWSAAWRDRLAAFGEFAGRRARGLEYFEKGSVIDLEVDRGRISARVRGTRLYHPTIVVQPLPERWRAALRQLAGATDRPLRELLAGRLPPPILAALTGPDGALPTLPELATVCTCPDRAQPCKHVFAALYAVAPRLDDDPTLLFTLRGPDLEDLLRKPDPDDSPLAPDALADLRPGSSTRRRTRAKPTARSRSRAAA